MAKMTGLERKRKIIDTEHEKDIAEGIHDYREMRYENNLTHTGNTASGGEYQTSIIYDSDRKIIGAASIFKKHDALTAGSRTALDDFLEAEEIAKEYGLDVILPEHSGDIVHVTHSGMYDIGGTGRGDIPLPGPIRRALALGQTPTYNKSPRNLD
jgi:hypothetical protein